MSTKRYFVEGVKYNYENIAKNYLEMAGNAINWNYCYRYVRLGCSGNLFREITRTVFTPYRCRYFYFCQPRIFSECKAPMDFFVSFRRNIHPRSCLVVTYSGFQRS